MVNPKLLSKVINGELSKQSDIKKRRLGRFPKYVKSSFELPRIDRIG